MRIWLTDLRVTTLIGVGTTERKNPQTLMIDVGYSLSSHRAMQTDALTDSIDYSVVARHIQEWATHQRYFLLEGFLGGLLKSVTQQFPDATNWEFKIRKYNCVPECAHVMVHL